jgi:intein-encoded DNA endonuclease-like protein
MKPFGSQSDTERHTVARILELRSSGMALDKIALALNEEGLKPKYGARWYGSSVSNVIRRGGSIHLRAATRRRAILCA